MCIRDSSNVGDELVIVTWSGFDTLYFLMSSDWLKMCIRDSRCCDGVGRLYTSAFLAIVLNSLMQFFQYLSVISSIDSVSLRQKLVHNIPPTAELSGTFLFQKMVAMIFRGYVEVLIVFIDGECAWHHCIDCCFILRLSLIHI